LTFGNRLRDFRTAREISIQDLALKVGASRQMLYYLEKDEKSPSLNMLQKLAAALGVTPNELLGVSETQEKEVS